MKSRYKYDISISVAEEDRDVARQLVAVLARKKIKYYYYEEQPAESLGEYLIKITQQAFGRQTRFVLLIISKVFVTKYWSGIEYQIAQSDPTKQYRHLLPLRLDDTPVVGFSDKLVYIKWENNPEHIGEVICKKIKAQIKQERWKTARACLLWIVFFIIIFLTYYFSKTTRIKKGPGPVRSIEQILVINDYPIGNDSTQNLQKEPDSFYISSTEVTVAQYLEYCTSMKKTLPPQSPYTYENSPVVNVTWAEADAFCKWKKGRLPTEAEWQYAATAGFQTKYSGGNNAQKVAVYNRVKPAPVASRISNVLNIYDMTGNVAEWCSDWSDSSRRWRSVRGGAYNSKINPVNELSVFYRAKEHPEKKQPYIGFRVVWDKKN